MPTDASQFGGETEAWNVKRDISAAKYCSQSQISVSTAKGQEMCHAKSVLGLMEQLIWVLVSKHLDSPLILTTVVVDHGRNAWTQRSFCISYFLCRVQKNSGGEGYVPGVTLHPWIRALALCSQRETSGKHSGHNSDGPTKARSPPWHTFPWVFCSPCPLLCSFFLFPGAASKINCYYPALPSGIVSGGPTVQGPKAYSMGVGWGGWEPGFS